jgi:sRNA-binding carbon storage regulator CsrA
MNINLTFQSADYEFIVEAIKLRTTAILEAMSMQYDSQMMAANTPQDIAQQRQEINEAIQSQFEKELAEWELTQQGNQVTATLKPKKIKVAKRPLSRVNTKAPYGYKKDGTPKKAPGRPATK